MVGWTPYARAARMQPSALPLHTLATPLTDFYSTSAGFYAMPLLGWTTPILRYQNSLGWRLPAHTTPTWPIHGCSICSRPCAHPTTYTILLSGQFIVDVGASWLTPG